jgi:hypothetical protein
MESHEFDKYIGSKLREAENARGEREKDGMNRVWSTIEPQLATRTSFQWVRMAAIILLLMMPSVFLYLRNREQGRQIRTLNSKLTLIDRDYRMKLRALALNRSENVVVQHDTVKLVRTVEKKIIPEAVEIVRYVTDTVIIYQLQDGAGNLVESEPAVPPAGVPNSGWEESPVKTEYILSKDATSAKKKKKGHSFHISLGTGNNSPQTEPELAFRTKL